MIHAFLAGFAGAIGVLCAIGLWSRIAAWRAAKPERQLQRRLIAEQRDYWLRVRQEQRNLAWARKRAAVHNWFWRESSWARGAVVFLWFGFLVGGFIAVFAI